MQDFEIELGIGDSVRFGDQIFTVVDIEDGEVCLRIDSAEEPASIFSTSPPAK